MLQLWLVATVALLLLSHKYLSEPLQVLSPSSDVYLTAQAHV